MTLYFDNYPEEPDSVEAFRSFYRELDKRLNGKPRGRFQEGHAVNLLFAQRALGRGIYDCNGLAELTRREDGSEARHNGKFLVLIAEPTVDTRKALRQELEACLTGERLREVQKTVVPVIGYDGHGTEALRDDILYFDLNFGGVGLWAYPRGAAVVAAAAKQEEKASVGGEKASVGGVPQDIRKVLLARNAETGVAAGAEDRVCTLVCPNRWLFRGLFEVFAVLLVLSFIMRWAVCGLSFANERQQSYFYLYMACLAIPLLLLFLALVYCDPDLADIREGYIPFIPITVALVAFLFWRNARQRRLAEMP